MTPDEALLPSTLPDIPKCLQIRSITKNLITFAEAQNYSQLRRAAHVFIWAPWEGHSTFGEYRAAVLMHLRFDGTFGFAGGLVQDGEDLLDGLNREIEEEISWDSQKHRVTMSDYYNTHINEAKNILLHFFIKQIPYEDLVELEKRSLSASDFGNEVMGSVRVPLYTMANDYSGFPAFINNKFVGSAKQQLLLALHHTKIMNENEIEAAMFRSQNMKLAASRF